MRFTRVVASAVFLLSIVPSIAFAEIKLKIVDPQDAAVAGAEVQLLKAGRAAPVAVLNTSAEGMVAFAFALEASSHYRVLVLAPGFAVESVDLTQTVETVTIK